MSDQFTGVKPVEERHRIDAGRLADFLKQHMEGFRGPIEIEQFKGGQSNPTYRIGAGGRHYALRRKPPGKLLPSAHAVDREFKVIKALHGVGFPVAKPYVLCEDDAVIGTAFYVMDCIEGRILWDQSLPGMSKTERRAIWEELNRVIALLHSVDYKAVGLADFGKAGSYIERQVGRWTKQYVASETMKIEAMDRLIEWLPKNIPATDETTIVHGDYRLDNTVFHPTEPRMLAVLDWELSTLGDPLADFAYHCMSWHIPPGKFRGIAGLPLEEPAFRASASTRTCTSSAPDARASTLQSGATTWPTTCFASPRSCKASPSACSMAPRRASTRARLAAARRSWPNWAGSKWKKF